jgi:hypothetical protein
MTEPAQANSNSPPVVKPVPDRAGLRFTLFKDINPAPRKDWLIQGIFGAGEMSCVFGHPGSGKSMLAADAGCHIAAGLPWFGRRVTQGGVIYIAAERAKLVERRLAAFRKHHDIQELPLAVVAGLVDLRAGPEHVRAIKEYAADLERLTGLPTSLVIVDTVSRVLSGGDENSPRDMGALVASLASIQEWTGAHVLAVHHVPQEGNLRMRGHGALLGGMDTTLAIEKSGAIRTATIIKDNDGAEGASVTFDILSVTVSVDGETGEPTTAPVVVSTEIQAASQDKQKARLSDRDMNALDLLTELCVDGQSAPSTFQLPAGIHVVNVETWKNQLRTRGIIRNDDKNPRSTFNRISNKLKARKAIGERDSLVWRA